MNHSLWQRAVTRRTVSSLIIGAATLALGTAFVTDSQAQSNFPSQTIRIVTGFPAGGGSDLLSRLLAPKLQESLGQPVVVENRPVARSEEHTSELQSLMRISNAVFCL